MAFVPMIAVAALLLASKVWGNTHPSELVAASATVRDQYETGEDRLTEATDRLSKVQRLINPNFKNLEWDDPHNIDYVKRDIEEKPPLTKVNRDSKINHITKRSYYPFTSQMQSITPYQSITVWQAPTYQLNRPYYIPVFGMAGRFPMFYPPQPLLMNPGEPPKNPIKRPFKGPEYLPPLPPTTPSPIPSTPTPAQFNKTGTNITNRHDFDEPIWDMVTSQPDVSPNEIPTRRPVPSGFEVMHPPLDHERPSTTRRPGRPNGGSFVPPPRPPIRPIPTTTTTTPPPQTTSGPSPCVWAIIACCSTSNEIPNDCFEQRGCAGPFWDSNPCDSEYTRRAVEIALNYYNSQ